MTMHFCFNVKGDPNMYNPGTIFYYNGNLNTVQGVHNPEEYKYLQHVYKESTGLDLITYSWSNLAPVYHRIFGVVQPRGATDKIQEAMAAALQVRIDNNEAYWDPKFFTAQTRIKIVTTPGHEGEVIGFTTIGQKFAVLDTTTQCDFDWAKIRYNNRDAWIAMGDITGDEFGIRSLT